MKFRISRDNTGRALALVETAPGNAECEYTPEHPDFNKVLAQSGLEFADEVPEAKAPVEDIEPDFTPIERKQLRVLLSRHFLKDEDPDQWLQK